MKIVPIQDLVIGDVFCKPKDMRLRKRLAFIVSEMPKNKEHLFANDRITGREFRVSFKTYPAVYFLRHDDLYKKK